MVLLLIIPFSWKKGAFCLKYLKLNAAGIKILLERQSRYQCLPFVNWSCLFNQGNKNVHLLKRNLWAQNCSFPVCRFHRLFILFKYTIIQETAECNCCSFNIRAMHVTIGVTVLLGPIMIGDFSYWLRALAVWLHLQGCNTYSPPIHSPHNFSRLNRLNTAPAHLANLIQKTSATALCLSSSLSVAFSGDLGNWVIFMSK